MFGNLEFIVSGSGAKKKTKSSENEKVNCYVFLINYQLAFRSRLTYLHGS